MVKHILTYASGNDDEISAAITKISNSGTNVIGEVIYKGIGEGAVIIEDLIKLPDCDAMTAEVMKLYAEAERRRERTIRKVEQALGITLYDWQKDFIFYDKPYNSEISRRRGNGKTFAHCLRLCLSEGEPITVPLSPCDDNRNEFSSYLGADKISAFRARYFIEDLKCIYNKLREAGNIDLREITF